MSKSDPASQDNSGQDKSIQDNSIALHNAGVDLDGLMSVLSRHLYSTPTVALRELVQNAHDSIVRRRMEQPDWAGESAIKIIADPKRNILRIIDTGAGLTEDEIHKYLATVGVGYTRKLRSKNGATDTKSKSSLNSATNVNKNNEAATNQEQPEQNKPNDVIDSSTSDSDMTGLIGMFGLGFLSAFVLAKRVIVSTTSYQSPDMGCRYMSIDAQHYTVSHIEPRSVGTEVLLELNDTYLELLQVHHLHKVLSHYCALLVEPITIKEAYDGKLDDDNEEPMLVNPEPPPWRRPNDAILHPATARKQALAFASRFEKHFEPICTMPVEPQQQSDAIGMLWIQDGATYGTSDNRNLSVFLRGMLLDDDARDLLPNWAGFVGGVIESQQLTPTASREDLQRDRQFDNARHALNEALIQGLSQLPNKQPEAWRRVLRRHNEALLGAALCDERLFLLLMDSLQVPTSQGDLLVKQLVSKGTVHVVLDNGAGFEDMLFRALGIPVALGYRYAVVPFLRRWVDIKGMRLIELGTSSGNRQLFKVKQLDKVRHEWLQSHLCHDEKLIAASYIPKSLPLIVVPDREQALKKRLAEDKKDQKISQAALKLARQFTAKIEDDNPAKLYLNVDNPAVQDLLRALQLSVGEADGGLKVDSLNNLNIDKPNDKLNIDHQNTLAAVNLLKAFKTLLAVPTATDHSVTSSNDRLQDALNDLAASVQRLL